MKIIFAIKALSNQGGGAERVLVEVASELARRGHEITLLTNDEKESLTYYPVGKTIKRVCLGIGRVAGSTNFVEAFRRMISARKEIVELEPDIVVAFMHSTYIPLGIALIGTGIPLLASEHIGPEHYETRKLERILLQLTPFLARNITVVSDQIHNSFSGWLRRKMVVIPNPVSFTSSKGLAERRSKAHSTRTLLSVGRLSEQKNQRCLISAFAELSHDFPDWRLRIVGEGELRETLERQISDFGLTERVELPGAISNISSEYLRADLFVLPSTYESFGLATAEALLHHIPVVGFAVCPGTNSLIKDGENGVLVRGDISTRSLATALRNLMGDEKRIIKLANAPTGWLEEMYSLERVVNRWEQLIGKIVKN